MMKLIVCEQEVPEEIPFLSQQVFDWLKNNTLLFHFLSNYSYISCFNILALFDVNKTSVPEKR